MPSPSSSRPKRHIVIPDCQVRPDVDYSHLTAVGNYIAAKKPDVIVQIGDFADLPSLSSYDKGKASAEGKRYRKDIESVQDAMFRLLLPIKKERQRTHRKWSPELHLTLGNHEDRITRAVNDSPSLVGTMKLSDLGYERAGWVVHPFLQVVTIDQVEFAHYFVSGSMCRPVSSAAAILRQRQCSGVMGHTQKLDIAVHPATQHVAIMAGCCYTHNESYLTPQGNGTKRGIWLLNEVQSGTFDPCFVSLDYLERKYS